MPLPLHQVQQDIPEVGVIGLVLELEGAAVVEVDRKLDRQMPALDLHRNRHLLLHNLLVFLHLVVGPHALPRQVPLHQVDQDVPDGLEVVSAALLYPQMRINRCVSRSASQVLVLFVGNVLVRLGVPVLLAQPEVDEMRYMRLSAQPHQEILGLDIAVDVVL